MNRMQVEGKAPVQVATHLSGAVAAGTGKRVLARLSDGAIGLVIYGFFFMLPALVAISRGEQIEPTTAGLSALVGSLLLLALAITQVVLITSKGQTIGMKLLGLRWVSFADGTIKGGAAFGKVLLEGAIGLVSFGIATPIIWLATQDEMNRHWCARTTGIITIDIKSGRDTASSAPPVENKLEEVGPNPPWSPNGSGAFTSTDGSIAQPDALPGPYPAGTDGLGQAPATINEVPGISHNPLSHDATSFSGPSSDAQADQPMPPAAVTRDQFTAGPAPVESAQTPSAFAPVSDDAAQNETSVPANTSPFSSLENLRSSEPLNMASPTDPHAFANEVDLTVARRPTDSILLTFDDGTHHFLKGQALVGRAPEAEPGHPNAELINLHDPGRSISKIHIALTIQSGAVLIEDMHSTNGTSVQLPSGTAQAVLPGAPVLAPSGSTVYLGDRSVRIGG